MINEAFRQKLMTLSTCDIIAIGDVAAKNVGSKVMRHVCWPALVSPNRSGLAFRRDSEILVV